MSHPTLKIASTILAATLVFATGQSTALAQDEEAAGMAAAHAKLVSLMDSMDLFYKAKKTQTGNTIYTVLFEAGGESTKVTCGVGRLGTYGGKPVYSLWAWASVAGGESAMPPAVIKLVATKSDGLAFGSYSTSKDFTRVFSNCNIVLNDSTTKSAIFMCMGWTHNNRVELKKEIDAIQASGF